MLSRHKIVATLLVVVVVSVGAYAMILQEIQTRLAELSKPIEPEKVSATDPNWQPLVQTDQQSSESDSLTGNTPFQLASTRLNSPNNAMKNQAPDGPIELEPKTESTEPQDQLSLNDNETGQLRGLLEVVDRHSILNPHELMEEAPASTFDRLPSLVSQAPELNLVNDPIDNLSASNNTDQADPGQTKTPPETIESASDLPDSVELAEETKPAERANLDPEQSTKNPSRDEAINAVPDFAYENAFAGQAPPANGISVRDLVHMALADNKAIRVLGFAPMEASTFTSSEQAAFDPVFRAGVQGGVNDRQIANLINSGGAIGTGINEQRSDFFGPSDNRNQMSISKYLETGGTVEAGFGTNYLNQNPVGGFVLVNPSWRSAVNLRFTQPLGRGRGKDVTTAPLKIAQMNHGVATHEFRAQVNELVRDTQLAYWNWKLSQRTYTVRQTAVSQADFSVRQAEKLLEFGEGTLPDVQQAQDQLHRYRIAARTAKNLMEQARIEVAEFVGLPADHAWFQTPVDEPVRFAKFDRQQGLSMAMTRPELMAAQARVRTAQLQTQIAHNGTRPDLNLQVDYSHTGLEDGLDDSLETLFTDDFDDWAVRLEFARSRGQRGERAQLSRARIRLAQIKADQERLSLQISTEVNRAYQAIMAAQEVVQMLAERVKIARQQVEGRSTLYREGEGSLDLKIRAESTYVEALLQELASKIELQRALVRWKYVTNQQDSIEFVSK